MGSSKARVRRAHEINTVFRVRPAAARDYRSCFTNKRKIKINSWSEIFFVQSVFDDLYFVFFVLGSLWRVQKLLMIKFLRYTAGFFSLLLINNNRLANCFLRFLHVESMEVISGL